MNIIRILKKFLLFLIIYISFLVIFSGFIFNFNKYFSINSKGVVNFHDSKPKHWKTLDQLGDHVSTVIIISEDWAFYNHLGLDLRQIYHAFSDKFIKGKKLRGASTITQQTIKNLFLSSDKNIFRKINELILSLFYECFLDKKRILENYLNLVELGSSIYGVDQGAKFYFNKPSLELNYREAAFLAMLLPSPKKYSNSFKNKELSEYAFSQVNKILRKLVLGRIITEQEYEDLEETRFDWEIME